MSPWQCPCRARELGLADKLSAFLCIRTSAKKGAWLVTDECLYFPIGISYIAEARNHFQVLIKLAYWNFQKTRLDDGFEQHQKASASCLLQLLNYARKRWEVDEIKISSLVATKGWASLSCLLQSSCWLTFSVILASANGAGIINMTRSELIISIPSIDMSPLVMFSIIQHTFSMNYRFAKFGPGLSRTY